MVAFVAATAPSFVAIAAVTTPSLIALPDRFSRSADNTCPIVARLCKVRLHALPADQGSAMHHVYNRQEITDTVSYYYYSLIRCVFSLLKDEMYKDILLQYILFQSP